MGIRVVSLLLLILLPVILLGSCSPKEGVPGGQAGSRSPGEAPPEAREPLEVFVDEKFLRSIRWGDLSPLDKGEFNTGREDVQTGYYLSDVIRFLDVDNPTAVTLHGVSRRPVSLAWEVVAHRDNRILLGLTHKGTFKVVAGNSNILNRDGWVRHMDKLVVHKNTDPAGSRRKVSEKVSSEEDASPDFGKRRGRVD